MALRVECRCPDWARPDGARLALDGAAERHRRFTVGPRRGELVVVRTNERETASTLADVLGCAGYATVCERSGSAAVSVRGATAGVWVGGQLDDGEAIQLSRFCRRLAADGAPVVAILDFPRRDAVDRARQCGAAVVVGQPWINQELLETVAMIAGRTALLRAA
jgi:hypothetical protein